MEQYIEDKDVLKLWGSGSQYVNSEFGELTSAVAKNPYHIIVLDEAEKAHSSVLQSLLTPIDKGYAKDRTTERTVDFSRCIFIVTTNLGANTIEQLGELDVELDVKDLLLNSGQKNALSSEMVNRLGAGNIVLFKKLSPADLVQLAVSAKDGFIKRSAIDWKKNVLPELILNTLGGDVSPRSIKTQPEKLESTILSKAMNSLSEQDFHKLENITVNVEASSSVSDTNIVLFSNNNRLCEFVDSHGVNCKPAKKISEIKSEIERGADCFIFDDKSIMTDAKQLTTMLQAMPDCLFYLMTNNAESALNLSGQLNKLFQGVFAVPKRTGAIVTRELNTITSDIQLIKSVDKSKKRNLKPSYTIDVNNADNGVDIVFKGFSYKPSIKQNDLLPFLTFDASPGVSFDDVCGLDSAKQDLKLVVNAMNNSDYLAKRNTTIAKGCVLAGQPGTGKNMLAKALAAECGVSFFNVNSADLLGGNVVENINKLFDVVEKNAPAILFFDEIDAIAQSRTKGSELMRLAVNTLLVRLDGFIGTERPVFVLAATNYPSLLDPALMRSGRLEKHIYCDLPNADTRKAFIQKTLTDSNCAINGEQLDEITQMTAGASIALLSRIIRESFYTEIKTEKPWVVESLIEEIRTARFGGIRTDLTQAKEDIKVTAYHEAGHLVAHKLLFPSAKIELASVQPRGAALGMIVPGENGYTGSQTKQHILNLLQVLLAGLAAEHMQGYVGEKSLSGASDDRLKATNLAKKAVVDMGMSEQFGLAIPSQLPVVNSDITTEVNRWLSEAFDSVTNLLEDNASLLSVVADALIKQETLNANDIDELIIDNSVYVELMLAG